MLGKIINFQRIALIDKQAINVGAVFVVKIIGSTLGVLFSFVLARLLGTSGTGVYFLVFTIVSIGATIARFGLDNAILRFASVAYDKGDRSSLAALYRMGFGIVMVAGSVTTLFFWLLSPIVSLGGENSSEFQAALDLMLYALVPTALIFLQGELFKAVKLPGIATFFQFVLLPMLLILGAFILYWKKHFAVYDVVKVYVIGANLSVLLAVTCWNRKIPRIWKEQGYFDLKLLVRTSFPLLWVSSMNLAVGWSDILILGVWEDADIVGVYGVATRVASLVALILLAVNSVTSPQFAALYAQGKRKELERLAQKSTGLMLLAAIPFGLLLLIFPEKIMVLFGVEFVGGASYLRILTLGQLVNVSMGSVGYLLMMTGHERIMRNIVTLSALINITTNLILIPFYGATGAAMCTSFSLAFMNVTAFLAVKKHLKINTLEYSIKELKLCRHR